jgi:hypothetical protein
MVGRGPLAKLAADLTLSGDTLYWYGACSESLLQAPILGHSLSVFAIFFVDI